MRHDGAGAESSFLATVVRFVLLIVSNQPILIGVAIVEHAGNVLIGQRRPESPLGGYWEFPGGKVHAGETPEEAAVRECREETGLEVQLGAKYLTVRHRYAHGWVELHFFAAVPRTPSDVPAEPFRWVPRAELGAYPFPPANGAILRRLLGDADGTA